ncbi:MAG: TIGR02206 family membrane protein [Bacilli bacterium]|nr:TIGR02206 family membrane protein [Bacilli bacterium]
MREFFHYFFGAGDKIEFKYFSLAHILPILLAVGIIYLIYRYKDFLRESKWDEKIRLILSFTLIITEMSYFWRLVGVPDLNPNPVDHLPITVCGWAVIFSAFYLLTKNQTLFDITYFWLFSGTLFALATPTVIAYCGPTRFRYYQFWCEHLLGYIALFYMIFVHGMKINFKSIFKSLACLAVLAVIAYIANTTLGGDANYLFMATPEDTASVLDILPKNFVLRVFIMGVAILTLFVIAYLPWYFIDRKNKKKEA